MNQSTLDPKAQDAVACPAGFIAGGLACGLKASGADDLAVIVCPRGATAAAVFTRNLVRAAPVVISQGHLQQSRGRARAIVINSGCANAATGAEGAKRASNVINAVASLLKCPAEEILVNSTGVIGVQLADELVIAALPRLLHTCQANGLVRAATAIMTTDTRLKMSEQIVHHGGRTCRVVGIAKGAGMIHPNMATMIAVMMTDAEIEAPILDKLLRDAVERSFHRITVDGDTSTNDSAFLLASGEAGAFPVEALSPAINQVARDLAIQIVRDGEGATKLIQVRVAGAATNADALKVAQTIASSLLVRTSVAGGDPNWGRILAAAGRSGVQLDPGRIALRVNDLPLFTDGSPAGTPKRVLEAAYAADEVVLDIDLGEGSATDEFLTCDLTEQYVRVNAEYTS